jgi:hypothetical protein
MPEVTSQIRDFDPDKLLQDHGKDISSLSDRVAAVENKLANPEQLALTLETASSDSKKLDKLFSKLFCDMMKSDAAVRASIEERINAIDRNATREVMKKFGGKIAIAAWSLVVAAISAWIGHKLK